jgi:hypothetical protein
VSSSSVFDLPGINIFGDSIAQCIGLTNTTSNPACWSYILQQAYGINGGNHGVGGFQAGDMVWQMYELPMAQSRTGNITSAILCCTNDAKLLGTGAGGLATAQAELDSGIGYSTIPFICRAQSRSATNPFGMMLHGQAVHAVEFEREDLSSVAA